MYTNILLCLNLFSIIPCANSLIVVGGVSAGCFMAVQSHVVYSSRIKGMGCIAGGPYYCAQGNLEIALSQCMTKADSPYINIDYLETIVRNTANLGYIDPIDGLLDSKAWFYSALNDTVVAQTVVQKNYDLYTRFVMDPTQLQFINNHIGEHAQITNSYGNNCLNLSLPYINNCDYDAAGSQLSFLYNRTLQKTNNGNIIRFDQTRFLPFSWDVSFGLQRSGYAYVPENCKQTNLCDVAIIFHGCLQTLDDIGLQFVENSGYNGYENIIIIYPQAMKNVLNPDGCFDWWGYTGQDYASNISIQMLFIGQILQNISNITGNASFL
jgi:hypothetical protein